MRPTALGPAAVIASAAGFGLIPFFALAAYAKGVSVSSLLSIRFGIASAIFGAYVLYTLGINRRSRKHIGGISRSQLMACLFLGAMYAGHSTLYLTAVKLVPAALVAMCFYTYPALVAVFSSVILRQPLTPKVILALTVSSLGLVLVLGGSIGTVSLRGIALALATAVLYSIYIMVSDRVVKAVPCIWVSGITSASASVVLAAAGIATGSFSLSYERAAYYPVFGIALFCTVIPMFGFFKGISLIGPTKASILSMVEPIVTALFGVVLLNQRLSLIQTTGNIAVLTGSALIILSTAGAHLNEHSGDIEVPFL